MNIPYKKFLLWVTVLLFGVVVNAQERVSKSISKTYDMTNSGELKLDNKYGDITINGWHEDRIAIKVDVSVTHKKKANAEDLLKRIKTNFKAVGDFITISSEVADRDESFFTKYFNKANPFDFDRSNVRIDFAIYLPKNAEIDIINKFGDVIIENWKGKFKGDIQHGDVWLNQNLNNVDITLNYGNLRAKSINYGTIRLKNGGLSLKKTKDLRITSSGSVIKIDEVLALEIYSSKDEINIEEASLVHGDLKFTNMQLNNIDDEINLSLKISDFKLSNIHSSDASLTFLQESSGITLNIEGFEFMFEATLEQGLLRMPKAIKNIESRMVDKGNRIREIKATNGNNPLGKIVINGKKGIVLLKKF